MSNEASNAWKQRNRDKCAAQQARYRARHPERALATKRKWRKKNPHAVAAQAARARAKRLGVVNDLTADEWLDVLRLYDNRCTYCGTDKNVGMDHVVPLARGGPNTKSNVVPACRTCNSRKGIRETEECA